MERLRNFLRRPPEEIRLFIRVSLLILVVRLMLGLLPFRIVQRVAIWASPRDERPLVLDEQEAKPIARAVSLCARRLLPEGSCLTQALVVQWLFRRRGFPAELRLGVAKGSNDRLVAHAWIESDGHIVIGGRSSVEKYRVLPRRF